MEHTKTKRARFESADHRSYAYASGIVDCYSVAKDRLRSLVAIKSNGRDPSAIEPHERKSTAFINLAKEGYEEATREMNEVEVEAFRGYIRDLGKARGYMGSDLLSIVENVGAIGAVGDHSAKERDKTARYVLNPNNTGMGRALKAGESSTNIKSEEAIGFKLAKGQTFGQFLTGT